MKTSDSILNSTLQAGGIEVKLSLRKMTLRILFLYILFMLAGSAAYVYIWEDMSAYGLGHYIGEFWGRHALFAIFLVVLIRCNWAGAGVYLRNPIALKSFRIILLLPGILLGVLPTLHGFCGGHPFVYIFGLVGIVCALGDFTIWYKLRSFHDNDLYQAGRDDLHCTIIQRNFASDTI